MFDDKLFHIISKMLIIAYDLWSWNFYLFLREEIYSNGIYFGGYAKESWIKMMEKLKGKYSKKKKLYTLTNVICADL